MKTILLINNYDMAKSRKSYLDGKSPSQHSFGTNELIETGEYTVDYALISPSKSKYRIFKLLSLIPVWFKLYNKAKKYDYVYGAADFTVDFLGVMKKVKLFKPKLITIFHHPPFKLRYKIAKYDKVILLSEYTYKELCGSFPSQKDNLEFIQWGPDLDFYKKNIQQPNSYDDGEVVFISNGKTHRDHISLVAAAEKTKSKTIIVSDEASIPANYNKDSSCVDIYIQNKPDDSSMVKLLNKCSVLVIPTPATPNRLGPIGLTSFLDAVALGMPIITADNTVFTDIVLRNHIGLVYRAGDVEDLSNKMSILRQNKALLKEYAHNSYQYGLDNDICSFSNKLKEIFDII